MNTDFDYLRALVEEFFHQRRVGKALSIIEDNGITGWEVWFQVEFASFLSLHSSEPEWWREWPVEYDGRIEKEHLFCRPDFIIRKKGWRRESYAALEVKQHPEAGICFSNLMKDIKKVAKVRASALDIRTFWVLGIHQRKPKPELRDLIISKFDVAGLPSPNDHMLIKHIPGCNYSYSMF